MGIAPTPNYSGYWLVDNAGDVYAYGDAQTYSTSGTSVADSGATYAGPGSGGVVAVGMAPTADGKGYFVALSNGDVASYGDAPAGFNGAAAGSSPPANPTIVGITPAGPNATSGWLNAGYWLVDSSGNVYVYGANFPGGSAPQYGHPSAPAPVVSITESIDGKGYWVTDTYGDVYNFGSAGSYGSLTASHYNTIGGLAMSPNGKGYSVFSTDDSVFSFGDADLPAPSVDQSTQVQGTGTVTTPSFSTTGSSDVLVAFAAMNGPSSGSQSLQVTGAGLTWSQVQQQNGQQGDVEIWSATAATTLSNVTVTSTPSSGGYDSFLSVIAFKGAVGVGAATSEPSSSATNANGAAQVPLTTTGSNSLVYGVGFAQRRSTRRPRPVIPRRCVDATGHHLIAEPSTDRRRQPRSNTS